MSHQAYVALPLDPNSAATRRLPRLNGKDNSALCKFFMLDTAFRGALFQTGLEYACKADDWNPETLNCGICAKSWAFGDQMTAQYDVKKLYGNNPAIKCIEFNHILYTFTCFFAKERLFVFDTHEANLNELAAVKEVKVVKIQPLHLGEILDLLEPYITVALDLVKINWNFLTDKAKAAIMKSDREDIYSMTPRRALGPIFQSKFYYSVPADVYSIYVNWEGLYAKFLSTMAERTASAGKQYHWRYKTKVYRIDVTKPLSRKARQRRQAVFEEESMTELERFILEPMAIHGKATRHSPISGNIKRPRDEPTELEAYLLAPLTNSVNTIHQAKRAKVC